MVKLYLVIKLFSLSWGLSLGTYATIEECRSVADNFAGLVCIAEVVNAGG